MLPIIYAVFGFKKKLSEILLFPLPGTKMMAWVAQVCSAGDKQYYRCAAMTPASRRSFCSLSHYTQIHASYMSKMKKKFTILQKIKWRIKKGKLKYFWQFHMNKVLVYMILTVWFNKKVFTLHHVSMRTYEWTYREHEWETEDNLIIGVCSMELIR